MVLCYVVPLDKKLSPQPGDDVLLNALCQNPVKTTQDYIGVNDN